MVQISQEAYFHAAGVAALHLAGSRGTGEMAIVCAAEDDASEMEAVITMQVRQSLSWTRSSVLRVWGKKIAAMETDKEPRRDHTVAFIIRRRPRTNLEVRNQSRRLPSCSGALLIYVE
ncbi:uncharacterized protein TrAFT101_000417 [Trichoderma asperellum]|uniref:uncharacterized protein n=1 Tax=Trichoderma asperellum TaxID=101201 RepID=UPI0033278125|nr:hypothetical protein TrAFT101_000417 [Trichoderma asperellum]